MQHEVISGIRPSFPGLSQSRGQVAHVLLTRSPLVYPRRGLTVRLACVKHAASVRPEPGSNSPLKKPANTTTKRAMQQLTKQRVQPLTEPITGSIINQPQRNPHPTPTHHPQAADRNQARGFT